jgi:hypothetical protein
MSMPRKDFVPEELLFFVIIPPPESNEWFHVYYLNFAPIIYCGLKPPVFKGRIAITILTIAVLCLRVVITPTAL